MSPASSTVFALASTTKKVLLESPCTVTLCQPKMSHAHELHLSRRVR